MELFELRGVGEKRVQTGHGVYIQIPNGCAAGFRRRKSQQPNQMCGRGHRRDVGRKMPLNESWSYHYYGLSWLALSQRGTEPGSVV